MDKPYIDRIDVSNITLTLFFKTRPILHLFEIRQCIRDLEPLLGGPHIQVYDITPLSFSILFEQKDPHNRGLPHIHNIHVSEGEPVPAPHPSLQHAAQLRCHYQSGGSETPEPIIALYKVAFAFAQQDLLALWDPDIDLIQSVDCITSLFEDKQSLRHCRNLPPFGLWTNFFAFERPGGGTWFYTKGFYRFGMAEFAYLGTPQDELRVSVLFSQLFATLFQSYQFLQVGEAMLYAPGIWITAAPLLEYQDILQGPLGTLVLQSHQEEGVVIPFEQMPVDL